MRSIILILIIFLISSCNENESQQVVSSYESDSSNIYTDCITEAKNYTAEHEYELKDSIQYFKKKIQIDEIIQQKIEYAKFNGTVLVAEKGVIVYSHVHGYKNLETKDSLKINTPFQLASLSKPFTALGILHLIDEGKLALDSTVAHYANNFPFKKLTIRHLLAHTSGLPDYAKKQLMLPSDSTNPKNADLFKLIVDKPFLFEPYFEEGTKFYYSNTNYALLAYIAEIASGKSFEQYMQDDIFEKLHMTDTGFFGQYDSIFLNKKAIGHIRAQEKTTSRYDYLYGDKSMYASVLDLFNFYLMLKEKCFFKDKTLWDEMLSPQTPLPHKYGKAYGLGFRMYVYPSKKYIFHNGLWGGFNTTFFYSPSDDYAVILLTNTNNRNAYEISGITDALQDEYVSAAYYQHLAQRNDYNPEEANIRPAGVRDDFDLPSLKIDTAELRKLRGEYNQIRVDTSRNVKVKLYTPERTKQIKGKSKVIYE